LHQLEASGQIRITGSVPEPGKRSQALSQNYFTPSELSMPSGVSKAKSRAVAPRRPWLLKPIGALMGGNITHPLPEEARKGVG